MSSVCRLGSYLPTENTGGSSRGQEQLGRWRQLLRTGFCFRNTVHVIERGIFIGVFLFHSCVKDLQTGVVQVMNT